MINEYLNEVRLGLFLEQYIGGNWVHNKKFMNSQFRPDYVNHEQKIVVEFDGYRHFSELKVIVKDESENIFMGNNGYKIIRIPYFVQFNSSEIIEHYFGIVREPFNDYPHGFISVAAMLPYDFNLFGFDLYKKILRSLPIHISNDIHESVKIRLKIIDYELISWYCDNFK